MNTQTKQKHVLAMHLNRAFTKSEGKVTMAKIYGIYGQTILQEL